MTRARRGSMEKEQGDGERGRKKLREIFPSFGKHILPHPERFFSLKLLPEHIAPGTSTLLFC